MNLTDPFSIRKPLNMSGSDMLNKVSGKDVRCCDDEVGYRKSFIKDTDTEDLFDF